MTKPHLVSFDLCPYVQRSAVTLEEKGVDYDLTYIDLADKPDWFLDISPMGTVPVLRVGDDTVLESDVIAEYLDEVYEPRLHPSDPLDKALDRSWMAFVAGLGGPAYMMMVGKDEETVQNHASKAKSKLSRIEDKVEGPFFRGEDFRLIDACSASFMQRLLWLDARAPELGLFEDAPRCKAWAEALVARPSVKQSLKDDIEAIFDAYLDDHDAWLAGRAA